MFKKLIFTIFFTCIISSSFAQEAYYNDVDLTLTGMALKDELAIKVTSTHTNPLSYSDIWEASKVTDINPNNTSNVLLVYGWENGSDTNVTNDKERGINQNGGGSGVWNREHIFSRSLGNPNLGTMGPGADAHNLRACDAQRNSTRSNRKFTTGSGITSYVASNGGWYPGNEWKGDVARMIMYMYLRYGNVCLPTAVGIGNSAVTPDDMIDLFLQWNAEDPVSDFERQRNTFHESTSLYAQGNRNPFIDNPRLASRIWGGQQAEDTWGIFTSNDTQAPTIPTNLTVSNATTSSLDLSWTASTDNTAVTSYQIFRNGILYSTVTTNNTTLNNLNSNTTYSFTVLAKDIVNNASAQSSAINGTTLIDNQPPTIPSNVTISNETDTSFKITWSSSSDNTAVTGYDVYINGNLHGSTTTLLEYTVTNLSPITTYTVSILAKDAVGNQSNLSSSINATTTDGSGNSSIEIFISEYVEGSGFNKALEITNITGSPVNLSEYSIKRNENGGTTWSTPLNLSGTLPNNDVYVLINGSASLTELINEADYVHGSGEPLNFNGNDPVGLFKNGVLIDIVGVFNAGTANFAKDKTLTRKSSVVNPNTSYTTSEWNVLPKDNADNIGIINSGVLNSSNITLNNPKITIYPNPNNGNILYINTNNDISVTIFNTVGKQVVQADNKEIDISMLRKGLYIILIKSEYGITSKKLIRE